MERPSNFVATLSERNEEINFVFLPEELLSGTSRHSHFPQLALISLKLLKTIPSAFTMNTIYKNLISHLILGHSQSSKTDLFHLFLSTDVVRSWCFHPRQLSCIQMSLV